MSGILSYMEEEQRRDAFISALQYLLDSEYIEDERAQGITKQIIAQRSLDNLTLKQKYRYEQDVADLFRAVCNGCEQIIPMEEIENTYTRDMELGGHYCQQCMFDVERIGEA